VTLTSVIVLSYVSRMEKARTSTKTTATLFMQPRAFALSSGIAACLESPDSESFIRPVLSAMHHLRCTVVVPLSFPVHIAVNIARCAAQSSRRRQNRENDRERFLSRERSMYVSLKYCKYFNSFTYNISTKFFVY